jgi:hypothetical protein
MVSGLVVVSISRRAAYVRGHAGSARIEPAPASSATRPALLRTRPEGVTSHATAHQYEGCTPPMVPTRRPATGIGFDTVMSEAGVDVDLLRQPPP